MWRTSRTLDRACRQRPGDVAGTGGHELWACESTSAATTERISVGPNGASQKIVLDLGSRRYTSIVDLEVAKSLSLISQSLKSKLEMRYARDVRPNDLKQGNVILVGAAEANPWVELVRTQYELCVRQ